jgi:hypothetical protein
MECVAAEIEITGTCGCGEQHQIHQVIQLKVPEMKMFYDQVSKEHVVAVGQNITFITPNYFDDKLTMDIAPQPLVNHDSDPDSGTFSGAWWLVQPVDGGLTLQGEDQGGGPLDVLSKDIVIAGVDYNMQWIDLLGGKGGISIEAV